MCLSTVRTHVSDPGNGVRTIAGLHLLCQSFMGGKLVSAQPGSPALAHAALLAQLCSKTLSAKQQETAKDWTPSYVGVLGWNHTSATYS